MLDVRKEFPLDMGVASILETCIRSVGSIRSSHSFDPPTLSIFSFDSLSRACLLSFFLRDAIVRHLPFVTHRSVPKTSRSRNQEREERSALDSSTPTLRQRMERRTRVQAHFQRTKKTRRYLVFFATESHGTVQFR